MKVKILSLFDGMSCGAIAMQNAGLAIERYVAYEIDKYAIKVASHNFPFIDRRFALYILEYRTEKQPRNRSKRNRMGFVLPVCEGN
jgi:site-specific DNA-cytosine methylase